VFSYDYGLSPVTAKSNAFRSRYPLLGFEAGISHVFPLLSLFASVKIRADFSSSPKSYKIEQEETE
jgi:hypothetical protein